MILYHHSCNKKYATTTKSTPEPGEKSLSAQLELVWKTTQSTETHLVVL